MSKLYQRELNRFLAKLANEIIKIRTKNNFSKNRLSQEANISRAGVALIEEKDSNPTIATLLRVSKAMDIPLWKIIKEAETSLNT